MAAGPTDGLDRKVWSNASVYIYIYILKFPEKVGNTQNPLRKQVLIFWREFRGHFGVPESKMGIFENYYMTSSQNGFQDPDLTQNQAN